MTRPDQTRWLDEEKALGTRQMSAPGRSHGARSLPGARWPPHWPCTHLGSENRPATCPSTSGTERWSTSAAPGDMARVGGEVAWEREARSWRQDCLRECARSSLCPRNRFEIGATRRLDAEISAVAECRAGIAGPSRSDWAGVPRARLIYRGPRLTLVAIQLNSYIHTRTCIHTYRTKGRQPLQSYTLMYREPAALAGQRVRAMLRLSRRWSTAAAVAPTEACSNAAFDPPCYNPACAVLLSPAPSNTGCCRK